MREVQAENCFWLQQTKAVLVDFTILRLVLFRQVIKEQQRSRARVRSKASKVLGDVTEATECGVAGEFSTTKTVCL